MIRLYCGHGRVLREANFRLTSLFPATRGTVKSHFKLNRWVLSNTDRVVISRPIMRTINLQTLKSLVLPVYAGEFLTVELVNLVSFWVN